MPKIILEIKCLIRMPKDFILTDMCQINNVICLLQKIVTVYPLILTFNGHWKVLKKECKKGEIRQRTFEKINTVWYTQSIKTRRKKSTSTAHTHARIETAGK